MDGGGGDILMKPWQCSQKFIRNILTPAISILEVQLQILNVTYKLPTKWTSNLHWGYPFDKQSWLVTSLTWLSDLVWK